MIAAQQLAQAHRAEQQQAEAEAAVQAQLAEEAQVQADHYAALAADPPTAFSETLFAYDLSGHLIGEYRADGTVLREYAWLEDQPLALLVPGGLLGGAQALYYHVDQLNTPQRLSDASGRVVWDGVMRPFGAVEVTVAEVEQGLRFPGQQFDAETGLHYNYFRDYDAVLGRYRETDPIGLWGGLNLYEYVGSNTALSYDAFGLEPTRNPPPICKGNDCVQPPVDPSPSGPKPSPQPPKPKPKKPGGTDCTKQPSFGNCMTCCSTVSGQQGTKGAVGSTCSESCYREWGLTKKGEPQSCPVS